MRTSDPASIARMTGDGTIVAAVAAGVAADPAGNANVASTSTDNEVTYDTTAPSVTIDQAAAQADPTNLGTVTFDVAFSEIITGFTSGDVTLSGTTGATSAVVAGGPAAFTVTVSGMTGDLIYTAYGVSKAGLIVLTKYIATQYGKDGIRCNAITPGKRLPTPCRRPRW